MLYKSEKFVKVTSNCLITRGSRSWICGYVFWRIKEGWREREGEKEGIVSGY